MPLESTPCSGWREAELVARVDGLVAELLLDAQQLVVLGEALRAARRARLDLARLQPHGEVGDERVFCLSRAVGGHHAPVGALGERHSLDGLGDGADLVDLEQQRVARRLVNRLLHARGVGDQEVVAHNLTFSAHGGRHRLVRVKVILIEWVLDGDHGVVGAEVGVHLEEILAGDLLRAIVALRLEVEIVHLLLSKPKLGGGDIHANLHLPFIACVGDRLLQQVETLLVLENVGRKAALVANVASVLAILLLDDRLEIVVDLGTHLHRVLERARADRQDHELLHRELVARMAAAVDHVERRHRKVHLVGRVAGELGNVLVEWHTLGRSARLAHRHRHAEDRVRAKLRLGPAPFVLAAVQLHHHLVINLLLGRGALAHEGRGNDGVDIVDRLAHALAHVVTLNAVTQLERLVDASRRTRWHSSRVL
mmetsp:Transcript_35903/g.94395  ORF Transcript_35903/g.94395 Transcript_35903/m.94395 type:complete len:425 (-) Transcript_35903:517-1791(-)